jgi:hypothetical protein
LVGEFTFSRIGPGFPMSFGAGGAHCSVETHEL